MNKIKITQTFPLYIWKFVNEQNYQGWNFVCNQDGVDCILDILNDMKNEKYSSICTFSTTKPTRELIGKIAHSLIESKKIYSDKFHIIHKPNIKQSSINFNQELKLICDLKQLFRFEKSLKDMRNSIERGVELENDSLIFWSCDYAKYY